MVTSIPSQVVERLGAHVPQFTEFAQQIPVVGYAATDPKTAELVSALGMGCRHLLAVQECQRLLDGALLGWKRHKNLDALREIQRVHLRIIDHLQRSRMAFTQLEKFSGQVAEGVSLARRALALLDAGLRWYQPQTTEIEGWVRDMINVEVEQFMALYDSNELPDASMGLDAAAVAVVEDLARRGVAIPEPHADSGEGVKRGGAKE